MKIFHAGTCGVIILTLLLSACGFHLRGHRPDNGEQALTSLHIKGMNRFDDIAANIRQLAKVRDIKITPEAEWAISLSNEEREDWQASITQSQTTREYYLRLYVTLNIYHKDITYNPIQLMEEGMFQDNADASSSKHNEKDIIIAELRQKLAEDILRRVEHIAQNPPDCDCDEPEPDTAE